MTIIHLKVLMINVEARSKNFFEKSVSGVQIQRGD
jgi:hypothetical protein